MWWILFAVIFLAVLVAIVAVFCLVPPVRWYAMAFLARYDFVFTNTPESYFKVVVRFGACRKILLSKQGHKVDENGDIVRLVEGEESEVSLPGGLRVVGLPLIDRIYTREMKFSKSLANGEIKNYEVENVDKFYAKVDYRYALPFTKCEDKNNLPLLGHATLLAHVVGPERSLFATANFYETMIGLVLPSVRECLKGYSFDEIKDLDNLDELIWEKLREPNPEDEEPSSVLDTLREKYGIVIVALRIENIDPPEEYRDITLTKWKAERQADAATAVAAKEAEETEGRVFESVARANGITRQALAEMIKDNPKLRGMSASEGGFKEDFANARDILKRDRAGAGLEDIRVGNVDGSALEPIMGTLASMFGLKRRTGSRRSTIEKASKKGDIGPREGESKKEWFEREFAKEIEELKEEEE